MLHRRLRRRTSVVLATVAALAWLGAVGCGEAPQGEGGAEAETAAASAPEPAPAFDLPRLGGGRVVSNELAGRIVIIDFWATWCPPCEFQVPELNAFWDDHRDDPDLALFGVSVDTAGADIVAEWTAEMDVRYPILLDGEPLARKVGALGFPTLIVITPDGHIDDQHVGLIERATLEEAIARLRADAASAGEPPSEAEPAAS